MGNMTILVHIKSALVLSSLLFSFEYKYCNSFQPVVVTRLGVAPANKKKIAVVATQLHSNERDHDHVDVNVGETAAGATSSTNLNRRQFAFSIPATVASVASAASLVAAVPNPSLALDEGVVVMEPVQVVATGDVKKLFNEGRAMESQGNMLAAQRLFAKVTKIAPRVSKKKLMILIFCIATRIHLLIFCLFVLLAYFPMLLFDNKY